MRVLALLTLALLAGCGTTERVVDQGQAIADRGLRELRSGFELSRELYCGGPTSGSLTRAWYNDRPLWTHWSGTCHIIHVPADAVPQ